MRRAAAIALLVLAACGDEGGVLVEVRQSERLAADVTRLHLFVGTPDEQLGGFAGVGQPRDVIDLDEKLRDRPHTIQLVRGPNMSPETPVRVAVVGEAGDVPVGLGVRDVGGIPSDVVLRYDLVLEPVDAVITTDSGCLLLPDGTVVAAAGDRDCDGVREDEGDCDDLDPQVYPGAYDSCEGGGLGVDEDCNDVVDDGDLDQDGATCLADCDDDDPTRTPGRVEDCRDGIDADCDDRIDEGIPEICDDQIDNDCDPSTPDQSTEEICGDGYDNDCDALIDEGRGGDPDVDGDGHDCAVDCDDDDRFVHPGADERCNGIDDDCDAAFDEAVNEDQDPALCIDDCDDFDRDRYPNNNEVCDLVDNDCVAETLPAPLPCLADALDPCVYGFRACNEDVGLYGLVCEPAPAETGQHPGICDQFAGCATSQEGLACAGEPTRRCQVLVELDGGGVCPGAQLGLTTVGDPLACTWVLLGGMSQQGWTVGLLSEGVATPQPTAPRCDATFVVGAVPPGLQPGQFVVALFLGAGFDHAEVITIVPHPSNACALPSLFCAGGPGG